MSENAIAVPVKTQSAVEKFNPNDPVSLYMQTNVFEQLQRVSRLISSSGAIPKHLQGDEHVADCFLVAAQAFRWGMDPFAVAQSTYVLSGKVGYEGKLIAAVVNANPGLSKKLNYSYSGEGKQRKVRVFGTLKGETEPREVEGTVADWATGNKQWATMTDQMLAYRGAREWARRHMPEVMLGVYAEEELPEVIQGGTLTRVIDTNSLGDLGEVVEAKNDPQTQERKVIEVKAEVVEPKPKNTRKPKPEPELEPKPVPEPALSPEDAEIDALFSK
jgi:RecT family